MAAGYQSVLKIKEKSWTPGVKDKTKANFHVGMKRLVAEVTWKDTRKASFIPFIDEHGHQGMRIIIEERGDA